MRTYDVTLTGTSAMLMHADNIEWSDSMSDWGRNPENAGKSVAGDDRTPGYRWFGSLCHDGAHIAIPSDYVARNTMAAGAMIPTGKGKGTFKAQTQSGCQSATPFWEFRVNGKQIPVEPLERVHQEPVEDFKENRHIVQQAGFSLFTKRAKIGQSKHVRVRPRFDVWTVAGQMIVFDDTITDEVLAMIFDYGGRYKGLGDWRPGGKTPGPFGMFTSVVRRAGAKKK